MDQEIPPWPLVSVIRPNSRLDQRVGVEYLRKPDGVSTQNGWASIIKDRVEISALDDKSSCLLRHNRLKPIVRAETPTIFFISIVSGQRSGLVRRLLFSQEFNHPEGCHYRISTNLVNQSAFTWRSQLRHSDR